ncbi:MAG: aminotransferase class IV [Sedimentisphaerales bacterium]|nr:aminotransferase class IV [Sedimentisphaerales bacterium]
MQIVMIQDKFVPIEEVEPVYLDRGMFFGDGVYEVMRSYDGKLFAFEEHMERFAQSLAGIQIAGVDLDQVRARIHRAFEAAGIANAAVYFHITRGSAPRERVWSDDLVPNFFLSVSELKDNTEMKARGIAVSTYPDCRWKRCDIKSLNLLPNVMACTDAAKKGCGEAVFVDEAGLITEGAGSAFFAIRGRTLQTAPLSANILPSITRKFTIEAGRRVGLKIVEKSLTPDQAVASDELCVASTSKDVLAVVKFDDKVIGDGKPGDYTKRMAEEFRSFVA